MPSNFASKVKLTLTGTNQMSNAVNKPRPRRNPRALMHIQTIVYSTDQLVNLCLKKMYLIRSRCLESCTAQQDSGAILRTIVKTMKLLMNEFEQYRLCTGPGTMVRPLKFLLDTVIMYPFNVLLRALRFRRVFLGRVEHYVTASGDAKFGNWCRSKVARINVY